ncbi:MAG: YceI family protein [Saprospiraceae bacterium]|nr:YceI family protein [Saprospiraceae bacterium]
MKLNNKISVTVLIGAFIMLSAFAINNAMNWQIQSGYSIKFSGKDIEGDFEKISGEIAFDANNLPNSKMNVNIDVTSIATGNWLKNRHAKSDKWFNAEKFPIINFTSSNFTKSNNGYLVHGILDMHGVKKLITIPFTFQKNLFNGSFKVNRVDYGVGNLEGMSKKVSNEINITISVPVKNIK